MSAAKYKLDNLTVIIDNNRIQKMDTLENVMGISDWQQRFEAFGWACARTDGHDVDSLVTSLAAQNRRWASACAHRRHRQGQGS